MRIDWAVHVIFGRMRDNKIQDKKILKKGLLPGALWLSLQLNVDSLNLFNCTVKVGF